MKKAYYPLTARQWCGVALIWISGFVFGHYFI